MKILKVAFKNINSLAGDWTIDFTSADFRDGIFLIAGDTGAGKTSILDAITLALFGKTARVEISPNHNEVMTRGQQTCSADVVFTCPDGTYRAGWSQARTKYGRGVDPATGERRTTASTPFAAAKRFLSKRQENGAFKEIAGTPKELQKKITTLIGISSFDQFLRTTMLAQGKFDQFLTVSGKDTDKDRSAILEQATGTELYSRIGAAIHAKWQTASSEVVKTSAELRGAQAMDAQARAAKEAETAAFREKAQAAAKEVAALSAENAWHVDAAKLQGEKNSLDQTAAGLTNRETIMAPEMQRFEQAQKARKLMLDFQKRGTAKLAAEDAARVAADRTARIDGLEKAVEKATAGVQAAEQAVGDAQTVLDEATPRIERARELDTQIAVAERDAVQAREQRKAAETALADAERIISEGESFIAKEESEIKTAETSLSSPPGEIERAEKVLQVSEEASAAAASAADAASKDWEGRKAELEGWVASAQEALDLARKIESLTEKREMLHPGEACPLCGATEHPFCEGCLPKPDEKKNAYEAAVRQRDAVKDAVAKAVSAAQKAAHALHKAQTDLDRVKDAWQATKDRLTARIAAGKAKIGERRRLIDEAAGRITGLREGVEAAVRKVGEIAAKNGGLVAERRNCGIEGSADDYQKKLQKARDAAVDMLAKAKAGLASAQTDLGNGIKEREHAARQAEESAAKAKIAADAFLVLCREAGFTDEADWQTACWDEREIERVQREKKKLDDDRVMLKTRLDDWSARQAEFAKRTPSVRTADVVAADLASKTAEHKELNETALKLEGELNSDTRRREQAAVIAAELERLSREERRWQTLNRELGGAGGANFKLYAQGVTLSNLIEIGNEYLKPMTNDRYLMMWDADGADAAQLLPTIVDRRAGGERRPVTNLSGGERFQVSLALALGLSRLNAGTLSAETLFLDEGFGTLDEQTLDISISTLENLQRDGAKTIGIISHVKGLEERITTQIKATKTGNGLSVLSGAGVTNCATLPR